MDYDSKVLISFTQTWSCCQEWALWSLKMSCLRRQDTWISYMCVCIYMYIYIYIYIYITTKKINEKGRKTWLETTSTGNTDAHTNHASFLHGLLTLLAEQWGLETPQLVWRKDCWNSGTCYIKICENCVCVYNCVYVCRFEHVFQCAVNYSCYCWKKDVKSTCSNILCAGRKHSEAIFSFTNVWILYQSILNALSWTGDSDHILFAWPT